MKKLSISVAVATLIAFSLGYFVRGAVEHTPNISSDAEKSTVREPSENLAKLTTANADPNDASAPVAAKLDLETAISSTRLTRRVEFAKNRRERLRDFFLINGIGAERAEQIIQDLVDADLYIVQQQNAMIERITAENSEMIAQGGEASSSLTLEERVEFEAERETLYRQVFGEYYEAYVEYLGSYPQRRVVAAFSSGLPEPLEYAAKETMVQIMYEENSRLRSELESQPAGSGAQPTSSPQGWEAEKELAYEQLLAKRAFNERVLDRSKSYLTDAQSEQFNRRFDDDLHRLELLLELMEIDEGQ